MADEKQLAILRKGVEVWNEWRKNNPKIIPDLSRAYLREVDLREADFRRANLIGVNLADAKLNRAELDGATLSLAYLIGVNFSAANLSSADLSSADLTRANLSRANLNAANFRETNLREATLVEAELRGTFLVEADLREAELRGALLQGAILDEANLSRANFREAYLNYADLVATQALATNFEKAVLTGVCIKDWHINSETNFNHVLCDYVYLEVDQQERRPHRDNFAPGEFTKLFRKTLETVDLMLTNGLDWVAFLNSFQKLQVECGSDELFIQAFENKGDAFVIRVSVPPGADKAEIEKFLKRQYELETQLEAQKQLTDAHYRHCADLKEIARLLAGRTINVEARAVAESQSMSEAYQSKYDQRGANIGSNVDTARDNARVQSILHNYAPEQRQSLVDAAAEIQALLQQLEQSYPTNTPLEKQAVVTEAIRRIESNPTLKARVIGSLKKAGTEGIKELVDHPLINIFLAAVEGWQEP